MKRRVGLLYVHESDSEWVEVRNVLEAEAHLGDFC